MPDKSTWLYYKEGSYNKVYTNPDKTLVLKIAKRQDPPELYLQTDTPERSVRLWNLINPNLSPKARVVKSEYGRGWVCPFVEGRQASPQETHEGLIDLFNQTGRIVVDAIAPKNFVRTPDGQTMCVDIGMAVQMEARETRLIDTIWGRGLRRTKSLVSLASWSDKYHLYQAYFKKYLPDYSLEIHTVRALLLIKKHRPDMVDVTFLKGQFALLETLSHAYAKREKEVGNSSAGHSLSPMRTTEGEKAVSNALQQFDTARQLCEVKVACHQAIQNYIDSRGGVIGHSFQSNWSTSLFRDVGLTHEKVRAADALQKEIEAADTFAQVQQLIETLQGEQRLMARRITGGLKACLSDCLLLAERPIFEARSLSSGH